HARPTDTARLLKDKFTGISVGMAWLDFRACCRHESRLRRADIRRPLRYAFLLLCPMLRRRGPPRNVSGTNGGIGRIGGNREVSHPTDTAPRSVLAPGSRESAAPGRLGAPQPPDRMPDPRGRRAAAQRMATGLIIAWTDPS